MKIRKMTNEQLVEAIKNAYRNCPYSKYFYYLRDEMNKRVVSGRVKLDKVTKLSLFRHGGLIFSESSEEKVST